MRTQVDKQRDQGDTAHTKQRWSIVRRSRPEWSNNYRGEDDSKKWSSIREYIKNDIFHSQFLATRQHTRYRQQVKRYTSKIKKKKKRNLNMSYVIKASTQKEQPQQPHACYRNVRNQSHFQSNTSNVHTNYHR